MESLSETPWDVTISGTGLAQSLLALALSRSGKTVLHVDSNPYYGGSEAAFSLQEAREWSDRVGKDPSLSSFFEDVAIESSSADSDAGAKLSPSRAYTLSLSPYLIYSRSQLIPALVSSKVYRQLEFQAVGSWWVYQSSLTDSGTEDASPRLYRVPSSREDVFADDSITVKSKRTLMKFLRHIRKSEQESGATVAPEHEEDLSMPFSEYLSSKFQVPCELHDPLLSLALSQYPAQQTRADFAVSRVQRHLSSIGVFGAGFGSLLVKWGGGSEISQVGCRALAVGGGVYVLNTGIRSIADLPAESEGNDARMVLQLSDGEIIRTKYVVGSDADLPIPAPFRAGRLKMARSITIVSSLMNSLFPPTSEGGPVSAGAVVVFPGSSISDEPNTPPVFLLVHSSETGECPAGQCVVYASVSVPGSQGQALLKSAVDKLLQSICGRGNGASALWSLKYTQLGLYAEPLQVSEAVKSSTFPERVFSFPPPSLDLAFDDQTLGLVREVWTRVMGQEATEKTFMQFEDREVEVQE